MGRIACAVYGEGSPKEALMLYLVAGVLKEGAEPRMIELRNEWNEHLSQPNRRISLFGALRGKDGRRAGYLAFLDADSFDDADEFLKQSPFYRNGLYERVEVAEFQPQVGAIEA
jgi:uncharacterized protein YciI